MTTSIILAILMTEYELQTTGGPATAAAFAGSIGGHRSLVVAATLWGIVGYAVGTTVGVTLSQFLLKLFAAKV